MVVNVGQAQIGYSGAFVKRCYCFGVSVITPIAGMSTGRGLWLECRLTIPLCHRVPHVLTMASIFVVAMTGMAGG